MQRGLIGQNVLIDQSHQHIPGIKLRIHSEGLIAQRNEAMVQMRSFVLFRTTRTNQTEQPGGTNLEN